MSASETAQVAGTGDVDVASLDSGSYPTTPAPPMGKAGTEQQGLLLEAQRMANNVVGPWEVDAALTGWTVGATGVRPDSKTLNSIMGPDLSAVAANHNFILGFSSGRQSTGSGPLRQLLVAVLRFPDPDSATAAASEMLAKAITSNPDIPKRSIPVPGHSDANAYTMDTNDKRSALQSYTAHGSYLLYDEGISPDGADAATQLVAGTLDRQKPLIDRFYAADPATFADLPRDPTELLASTLPLTGDDTDPNRMTVYEPRAALNFEIDPVTSATLFTQAGVQHISVGKTTVYEAIDAVGAGQLIDGFVEQLAKQTPPFKTADAVAHLPNSKCVQLGGDQPSQVSCFAAADQYLIEADSAQLADAHQQAAAQYRMLIAK